MVLDDFEVPLLSIRPLAALDLPFCIWLSGFHGQVPRPGRRHIRADFLELHFCLRTEENFFQAKVGAASRVDDVVLHHDIDGEP